MEVEGQKSPIPSVIENPALEEQSVSKQHLPINASPSKIIKLKANSSSAASSPSTSPTKKLKSKRKVVVLTQQNIYQQVQTVVNSQNKENSNGAEQQTDKIPNGNNINNYVGYSNSESEHAIGEDEVDSDFLDINISDNINLTLV